MAEATAYIPPPPHLRRGLSSACRDRGVLYQDAG